MRFSGKSEFVLGFSNFLTKTLRNTPGIANVMEPPEWLIVKRIIRKFIFCSWKWTALQKHYCRKMLFTRHANDVPSKPYAREKYAHTYLRLC